MKPKIMKEKRDKRVPDQETQRDPRYEGSNENSGKEGKMMGYEMGLGKIKTIFVVGSS